MRCHRHTAQLHAMLHRFAALPVLALPPLCIAVRALPVQRSTAHCFATPVRFIALRHVSARLNATASPAHTSRFVTMPRRFLSTQFSASLHRFVSTRLVTTPRRFASNQLCALLYRFLSTQHFSLPCVLCISMPMQFMSTQRHSFTNQRSSYSYPFSALLRQFIAVSALPVRFPSLPCLCLAVQCSAMPARCQSKPFTVDAAQLGAMQCLLTSNRYHASLCLSVALLCPALPHRYLALPHIAGSPQISSLHLHANSMQSILYSADSSLITSRLFHLHSHRLHALPLQGITAPRFTVAYPCGALLCRFASYRFNALLRQLPAYHFLSAPCHIAAVRRFTLPLPCTASARLALTARYRSTPCRFSTYLFSAPPMLIKASKTLLFRRIALLCGALPLHLNQCPTILFLLASMQSYANPCRIYSVLS